MQQRNAHKWWTGYRTRFNKPILFITELVSELCTVGAHRLNIPSLQGLPLGFRDFLVCLTNYLLAPGACVYDVWDLYSMLATSTSVFRSKNNFRIDVVSVSEMNTN